MSFTDTPAGQPSASKRQSPFHQFSQHDPPPSLFYSCLLSFLCCFSVSISHFHAMPPPLFSHSEPLGLTWLAVMVDTSVPVTPRELVNECIQARSTQLLPAIMWDLSIVRWWGFSCTYMWSHLDVTWCSLMAGRGERGIQQHVSFRIMENLTLISLIIGFYGCLYVRHKHKRSHTDTHVGTPVCFGCSLSPPHSRSERLHSPPYRLKPALTVLPCSHTPCPGGRAHYETITPLIDS